MAALQVVKMATSMVLLPDAKNCGMRMRRECRESFLRHRFQRKPLVCDPGMHHGTCVTHVPRCISGSLTCGGGETVPCIPGACATRNVAYLVRGPLQPLISNSSKCLRIRFSEVKCFSVLRQVRCQFVMYSGRSYDLDSRDEGRFREGDRHSRSRRHGDRRPRDDDLYQNMSHPNNRQCYKFYIDDPRRYEKCIRCHRKIYPTEKSDVGVALHKSCFRCSECNVTLTLHGYIIAKPENANRKGVYCKTHAPKPVRYALDETAMEIMNAVKSQQILKNPNLSKQVNLYLKICIDWISSRSRF